MRFWTRKAEADSGSRAFTTAFSRRRSINCHIDPSRSAFEVCRPYVTRRRARRVGRGGFQEGDVSGWVCVRRDAVVIHGRGEDEIYETKNFDDLNERKETERG